ncbi:D-alanine--D-alanine ligase [Desulfohalobiaceae bacterium Ax17]|jgi:D-alanine-D-alanine ligase|uniref:D-alanine--D-alanine ligase family protein n=1 Tax=Desulfovulcanus ferrireducens TaxID=2831190 RepID=UPI00207BBC6A|nr:D-alanine--D-alanine ligase [Desulfovulcanus ferrireducens]MBT8762528.1 D-alanine--D-alanine ligase [Desulfovulcanus ferrireducens]
MRVLLIAGGWSSEREVSLNGAKEIQKALQNLGHETIFFDLSPQLDLLIQKARQSDVAFINLHGSPGEDGTIQALLEDIGLPYQGSGPKASFLALNKAISKQIFVNHGLPTPDWSIYTGRTDFIPQNLTFPLVLKPNTGGSSLGIKIVHSSDELKKLAHSLNNQEFLLEQFIPGQELTCGVLDNQALPPVLIRPQKGAFFDYQSKYDPDGAEEICPAPISKTLAQKLMDMALKAHRSLGLKDYSRTDFIVDEEENIYILEVNTLPGMTKTSLLPKAAKAFGLSFEELIDKLISLALRK